MKHLKNTEWNTSKNKISLRNPNIYIIFAAKLKYEYMEYLKRSPGRFFDLFHFNNFQIIKGRRVFHSFILYLILYKRGQNGLSLR